MALEKWKFDTVHSNVSFSVRHLMISRVHGSFKTWSGALETDEANPANSGLQASIDVASIDTKEPQRDEHLRSADFFNAAKYPDITFSAASVTLSGESAAVAGTLTVRDQTKPVSVSGTVSAHGADEISLDAELPVNRGDFGLVFNQLGMMSLDNIIIIHAVFTRA